MLPLSYLKEKPHAVVALGSHPAIFQSMTDFDFLAKRVGPSLRAIIGTGKKFERLFWGEKEFLVPVYPDLDQLPEKDRKEIDLFLNVSSGRRALVSTSQALKSLPNLTGGVIFAESVPERHALEIKAEAKKLKRFVIGPASIGLLIPGCLKLGAIGGGEYAQIIENGLLSPGQTAVLSSSGGMTNEIINFLNQNNIHLSFALSFGGERFPCLSPEEVFLSAENDPGTKRIVYFGELGGNDEYELVNLIKQKKITKPIYAYIAGSVAEAFPRPPQFGHAKSLAQNLEETAAAKKKKMREAGIYVGESFQEFAKIIKQDLMPKTKTTSRIKLNPNINRRHALFISSVSGDNNGSPMILKKELAVIAKSSSYAELVITMLLGKPVKSKLTVNFVDLILKLLVDHGPYVSGAVNTMITARAGKDLVSSLCSGLLTIGDRFGGAINASALEWLKAVKQKTDPKEFVEKFSRQQKKIPGIGHKKYSLDNPDPRVRLIKEFSTKLKRTTYLDFALKVEKITTKKKNNLILNVDGMIAALLLDILEVEEGYDYNTLKTLTEIEFFNALFVLSRSVGFTAHYLDQKRLDEGLFRLPDTEVAMV